MKEMNDLELQLRSWAPRRPSAKLEERLFGPLGDPSEALPVFRLRWLLPATVTFLLMCVVVNQRSGPVMSVTGRPGTFAAAALSNQSVAAWLPGNFVAEQNSLPAEKFEWTNANGWPSSDNSLRGLRGSN